MAERCSTRLTDQPQRWAAVPAPRDDRHRPCASWSPPPRTTRSPRSPGCGRRPLMAMVVWMARPGAPQPHRPRSLAPHTGLSSSWRSPVSAPWRRTSPPTATRTPTRHPGPPTRWATTTSTWTAAGGEPDPHGRALQRIGRDLGLLGQGHRPSWAATPGSAPTTGQDRLGATTSTAHRTGLPQPPISTAPRRRGSAGPVRPRRALHRWPLRDGLRRPVPRPGRWMVLLDNSSPSQFTDIPSTRPSTPSCDVRTRSCRGSRDWEPEASSPRDRGIRPRSPTGCTP